MKFNLYHSIVRDSVPAKWRKTYLFHHMETCKNTMIAREGLIKILKGDSTLEILDHPDPKIVMYKTSHGSTFAYKIEAYD